MAEGKELKPRSFRVDDETAERFKQIAAEIGGNQQETLYKLLETYEFQKGKAVLVSKKEDIEIFEKYIGVLARMYMASLEETENVTETVKVQFDALLKSKDSTIINLQQDFEKLEQDRNQVQDFANQVNNEYNNLKAEYDELRVALTDKIDNYESIIKDKDELNKALTEGYNSLKKEIQGMTSELEGARKQASELHKAIEDRDRAVKNLAGLDKTMKRQQKEHAQELESIKKELAFECEKKLLEKDKENNSLLQAMEHKKNEEVAIYQAKYLELLEQLKNNPSSRRRAKQTQTNQKDQTE